MDENSLYLAKGINFQDQKLQNLNRTNSRKILSRNFTIKLIILMTKKKASKILPIRKDWNDNGFLCHIKQQSSVGWGSASNVLAEQTHPESRSPAPTLEPGLAACSSSPMLVSDGNCSPSRELAKRRV